MALVLVSNAIDGRVWDATSVSKRESIASCFSELFFRMLSVGVGELQKWLPLTKLHFYNEENVPHQLFQKNWKFIELIEFIGGDLPPEPRVAAIADIQVLSWKTQKTAA